MPLGSVQKLPGFSAMPRCRRELCRSSAEKVLHYDEAFSRDGYPSHRRQEDGCHFGGRFFDKDITFTIDDVSVSAGYQIKDFALDGSLYKPLCGFVGKLILD